VAAALPRRFDQDTLSVLIPDGDSLDSMFDWLRRQAFVTENGGICQYHDVVRDQMVRLQRRQSPRTWREHHGALADHHAAERADLAPGDTQAWDDTAWQHHRIEETYHRLCAHPGDELSRALDQAVHGPGTARRWADMLHQAGHDTQNPDLQDWGSRLTATLTGAAPDTGPAPDTIACLTALVRHSGLPAVTASAAHTEIAQQHWDADVYDQTLTHLDRALTLDPANGRAFAWRGVTYRLMGRFEEALEDLGKAVALAPDNAQIIVWRGWTYREMGRFEEALEDLGKAVALAPDNAQIIAWRGETYRLMGRFEEALVDLDKAIGLDENSAVSFRFRSVVHAASGRFEEAYADAEQALGLAPEKAWSHASRGEAFRLAGRFREAIDDLTRAVELDPEEAEFYARRGQAHAALGHLGEARADVERSLSVKVLNAETRGRLDDIRNMIDRLEG
jgi:tetratricopeptide (TPR) repeat protein